MGISKETGKVIKVMAILVFISIVITFFYYRNQNRAEDPRVVSAKILYKQFQKASESNDFDALFVMLDSIENIYNMIPHYRSSYEIGVLNNNRSAIFLTISLYQSSDSAQKADGFEKSILFAEKSIGIYRKWLEKFGNLNDEEIRDELMKDFTVGLQLKKSRIDRIVKKRIKEIREAKYETRRRISVSYTNLGIALRHTNKAEEAAKCYKIALTFWDRNFSAKNNLNILLDRPLEEQSFIDKMFPPDRKE